MNRPGTTTRLPDSTPFTASSALNSAVVHMNEGTPPSASLSPAVSPNSVFTGPGHSAVARDAGPGRSAVSASVKERTNALVAA